jgi:hypothetical protein
MRSSRVFIRTRWLWLAWYPLRGRRCSARFERHTRPTEPARDGWCLRLAVGPAYFGVGPGVPTP